MVPPRFALDRLSLTLLVVSLVPLAQYAFGLIHFFGHAWICTLYIAGLLVAVLTGQLWEGARPGQLVDTLCLAIGMAATLSVCLQIYQWLEFDGMGIWLIPSAPTRPSANLAQPNQLATLLVWGALAVLWGTIRSALTAFTAIPLAMLLLFGTALTGSRTAWIAIAIIAGCAWLWKNVWTNKSTPLTITALGLYFFACAAILSLLGTSGAENRLASLVDNPSANRWSAWSLLLDAAFRQPLFGYGWGQVAEAHISVALDYPALHSLFSQSHNIFLDLLVWCGIPIGVLFSVTLIRWIYRKVRSVSDEEGALFILFILVLANHSLLEFPFQYAYFLLPAGLFIGCSIVRENRRSAVIRLGRWGITALFTTVIVMFAVTISDYFRVERSYELLRMEWAGFNLEADPQPPHVTALTQWREIISKARISPHANMSDDELSDLTNVTLLAHKPLDFMNLADALALNDRIGEARRWIERLCKIESERNCLTARDAFELRLNEIQALDSVITPPPSPPVSH